jgi:hypothetical protein
VLPSGSIDSIPVPKGVGTDGGTADAVSIPLVLLKRGTKLKRETTSVNVETPKRVCHKIHSEEKLNKE